MRTPFRPRAITLAIALVAVVGIAVGGVSLGLTAGTPAASAGRSLLAVEATPSPTTPGSPSDAPTASLWITAEPRDAPSAAPSAVATRSPTPSQGPSVATRVVIPDLGIDLAITKSPPAGVYPYCNVAMYFGKPFGQPGQDRATYLFAHARVGMFYPIYSLTTLKRTPNKMVGMLVDVYTSGSQLYVYRISKVLQHQQTLARAAAVTHDELWLQTSEGPHGTVGETQVVAEPVSVSPASYQDAHPPVHIVKCGY
jgi:hypothetical protein